MEELGKVGKNERLEVQRSMESENEKSCDETCNSTGA
jgi:hypothetical protein